MTHTADRSTSAGAPVFPPGRYGHRREPSARRWWIRPIVVVVIAAICTAITLKLYKQYGTPEFSPTVVAVSNITDTSMTVKFLVQSTDGRAATCTLNAVARDGTVVGTAQVPVPAGRSVTVTYAITTLATAYVADVPTCQPA